MSMLMLVALCVLKRQHFLFLFLVGGRDNEEFMLACVDRFR